MAEIAKTVQVIKLPDVVKSGLGKVLIVGGLLRDYPLFAREYDRFIFWCDDSQYSWRNTEWVFRKAKYIIVSQATPRTTVIRLENGKPEEVPLFRFTGPTVNLAEELVAIMPPSLVPQEYKEHSRLEQEKPILTVNDQPEKDIKTRAKRGELAKFVSQHANFDAPVVMKEVKRLLELAQEQGLPTTRASVYQTFSRLRTEAAKPIKTENVDTNDQEVASEIAESETAVLPIETEPSIFSETAILASPPSLVQTATVAEELKIPAEGRVAKGEEWFDSDEAVYVNFFPAQPGQSPVVEDFPRTNGYSSPRSKYIGVVNARSSKIVIPTQKWVVKAIEDEFKRIGDYPVSLPCFLKPSLKQTCWLATSIDYFRLRNQKLISLDVLQALEERVVRLESQNFQLAGKVDELQTAQKAQDAIVVFDFQNYFKSCEELGKRMHPSRIADKAAKHLTPVPRRILKIVIVDFDYQRTQTLMKSWRQNKFFEFYQVPQIAPGEKNPTDQVVWQATYGAINALKLKKGGLVVIVTGDSDFIPLLEDLRTNGYETMIVSSYLHAHEALMGKADFYMDLI